MSKFSPGIVCFESFQDGRPLWTAGVAVFLELPFESQCSQGSPCSPQLSRNLSSLRPGPYNGGATNLGCVI